jgi:hypothetical protein
MRLLNLWFILNSGFFIKNNKTQRNTGFGYFRNNIELGDFHEKTSKGLTVIQVVVWYFEKNSKPWFIYQNYFFEFFWQSQLWILRTDLIIVEVCSCYR